MTSNKGQRLSQELSRYSPASARTTLADMQHMAPTLMHHQLPDRLSSARKTTMYAHFMHSIIGEWAGTTAVDAPGHVHWEGTPLADIHQAGTLPTPGVALLVGAPQATAVEAPAAAPDLSPEADLGPHCHPLVGGALPAQVAPLPGLLGSAWACTVCLCAPAHLLSKVLLHF